MLHSHFYHRFENNLKSLKIYQDYKKRYACKKRTKAAGQKNQQKAQQSNYECTNRSQGV